MICHTDPASPIAISMRFTWGMVGLSLETPEGETGLRVHEEVGPFGVQSGKPRFWYIFNGDLTNFECCVKLWTHFFFRLAIAGFFEMDGFSSHYLQEVIR